MHRPGSILALNLVASLVAATASSVTLSTLPSWNGTDSIGSFGEFNTATYGQTITAPVGVDTLDDFTFYVDDFINPDFVDFQAYVFEWNPVAFRAAGAPLYTSGGFSTTNNGGADGFEEIMVSTGGVSVVPGTQYVLAFSASNSFDGLMGTSNWGTIGSNASTDGGVLGQFVFQNNANNFSQLTTQSWSQRTGDTAFTANFSDSAVVPEPSTALLFGSGLILSAMRRRH